MECRDVIGRLLDMDNATTLPADLAEHIETCVSCRNEYERMSMALELLQQPESSVVDSRLTDRIMFAVRREVAAYPAALAHGQYDIEGREDLVEQFPAGERAEAPAPFRNWLIAGTLMLGGLFGLRFSEVMAWLRQSFGPAIDVAMSVILGVFLTAYICMLVGSNLGRVQRVFRLR